MVRPKVRASADLEAAPDPSVAINRTNTSSHVQNTTAPMLQQQPSTGRITPPPYRTGECEEEKLQELFKGKDGQCLLLAFQTTKRGEYEAVVVPIDRPSIAWATRMEALEKEGKLPPLSAPKSGWFHLERWRQIRNENRGESEEEIWRRIKEFSSKQQPPWRRWTPFFRPVSVEERNFSLLRRKGKGFQVEIHDHDTETLRKNIQQRYDEAAAELPDIEDLCSFNRDHFGDIEVKKHDRSCGRDEMVFEHEFSSGVPRGCASEHFERAGLRLEASRRYERRDFLDCFKDPTQTVPLPPLTRGRLFESCIYDGNKMQDVALGVPHALPQRSPQRLPQRLGLYIEYRFSMEKHEIVLASVACFVLTLGLLSKITTANTAVGTVLGTLLGAVVTNLINQMPLWHKDSTAKEGVKTTKRD